MQCLAFQAQVNQTASPHGCHDWLWPDHFGILFPARHPPNRTGNTEQGRKRLGADHGGSDCITDRKSSVAQQYRRIPTNVSDRPADERAVRGSRCCADRDVRVRYRWRQSLLIKKQYVLSRKQVL